MTGEAKKRKVHTPEFKAKMGLEASRGVKTIDEIGQEQSRPLAQAPRIDPWTVLGQ